MKLRKLRITISKYRSLAVFMPNITTNHAITYTNSIDNIKKWKALEITMIHGATRVTVITIVIDVLETISENANV